MGLVQNKFKSGNRRHCDRQRSLGSTTNQDIILQRLRRTDGTQRGQLTANSHPLVLFRQVPALHRTADPACSGGYG